MFVIRRTDKEYGDFTITHNKLEDAESEAERMSKKHAIESPRFMIYELVEVKMIGSDVVIIKTAKQ